METKTAHLITGTRTDVVEALTRMIMEKNPDAGEITFLELPERADFRALVEEPASQEAAPKAAEMPGSYDELKELCVKTMEEIGWGRVMDILRLFNLYSLGEAEGNRILIITLAALFQVIRFSHDRTSVTDGGAKEAAQKIFLAFDKAEAF